MDIAPQSVQVKRPSDGIFRRAKPPDWLPPGAAVAAVLVATLLILHTYSVFYQTYDEPAHIACGLQWLDRGTYLYEALHPPLARVATAILPYLHGSRDLGLPDIWLEGDGILEAGGRYETTLTLARLGVLPFFWLTCVLVWRFMAQRFGPWQAATAVGLLAFCPVVLGHSAVATTDAALMAMFLWSLIALLKLLEAPSRKTALLAGVATGLAVGTKFTEMPFLAVAGGLLVLCFWLERRSFPIPGTLLAFTFLTSIFTLWAVYRFSYGPILRPELLTPKALDRLAGMAAWKRKLLFYPYFPLDQFVLGLREAFSTGVNGRLSYALGKTYTGGRWYFFPVAVLTKTPIALLLLSLGGLGWMSWRGLLRQSRYLVLVCGLTGPLAIAILSQVNIGVRHVLPIFPFLAMLAAITAVDLWKSSGWRGRVVVVLLLSWNVETCLRTAPDFLAYFNEPAAPHASFLLIESDLDWGQDLKRLDTRLAALGVDRVSIQYHGTADPLLLPKHAEPLGPSDRPTGWIAISENDFREVPEYRWLEAYPYERIGRSIRLYHLATSPATRVEPVPTRRAPGL